MLNGKGGDCSNVFVKQDKENKVTSHLSGSLF